MTDTLSVSAISTYLAGTGWRRTEDWHGSGIWVHPEDYEVLVPARDGLGDSRARIAEILRCLAALEARSEPEIAEEIARPDLDTQYVHTYPRGHAPGYTSLAAGSQAIQGVRDLLALATRTLIQGPHFHFAGRSPNVVGDLLRTAELGPSRAGSYIIEIRVPAAAELPGELNGRAVVYQMFEAVNAAQAATTLWRPEAFEDAVTAGVSANLCNALSELSGPEGEQPFDIAFRWGRAIPVEEGTRRLTFPAGAGGLLRSAADRLRQLQASGAASITGVIETMHNGEGPEARWRICVRGELRTQSGDSRRRKLWVRLPDEASYERAGSLHHTRGTVRIVGELTSDTGRIELIPTGTIDVIDEGLRR